MNKAGAIVAFIRATVLLADDEPVFGETTAELLRRAGFGCDLVDSADAAIRHLHEHDCDVLVADIVMPGNARLDLLEHVRSLRQPPTVILVTGYPSVETAVGSLEKGVFAYKVKPFDIDDFIATVGDAARQARLRRGLRHEADRSQALARRMEELRDLLEAGVAPDMLKLTAQQYIGGVLASIIESLVEALGVLELAAAPEGAAPLRTLVSHPDIKVYQEAIRHSIAVLESTKGAFKSRELADLRRKLDLLLQVVGGD
jgi:CheY-like chemotaxis protein